MGTAFIPTCGTPGSIRLSCAMEGGRQACKGSLMACCVWDLILIGLAPLGEAGGDLILFWQKCSAMLEQKCAICPLLGSQQQTLSFLEQLFLRWQLHISRSRAIKLPTLSILYNNRTFYTHHQLKYLINQPVRRNDQKMILMRASSNRLFFIWIVYISEQLQFQMGNSECCEEDAKGGQFRQGGSRFQPNPVKAPHNKFSTINFSEPPKNLKIVHENVPLPQYPLSPPFKMPPHKYSSQDLPVIQEELKSKSKPKEDFAADQIGEVNKESKIQLEKPHKVLNHQQSGSVIIPAQQLSFGLKLQEPSKQPQQHSINQLPDDLMNQEEKKVSEQGKQKEEEKLQHIHMPQLTQAVQKTLQTEKFFSSRLTTTPSRRKYNAQFYQGELDQASNLPNGYGKLYKPDGSLFIGQFVKGKVHAQGALIFSNGSFYNGPFVNNRAQGKKGTFHSQQLHYEGQFKGNCFHGHGSESGPNHKFDGEYFNHQKANGVFTWNDGPHVYVYTGTFDHNLFHGEGTLSQPNGTYKGSFIAGKKHGHGVYEFKNGLKYVGQYRDRMRNGKGILYNPNNRVAYEGQFENGLPHGNGFVLDRNGNKLATKWIQGIDEQLLP